MGNYYLKGAEGSVSLKDIETYEEWGNFSINTLMWVQIKSGPFSGASRIDIGLEQLKEFSSNIMDMYKNLSGEAYIKEVYGESYIKLKCVKRGHISVSGILVDFDSEQRLKFEFDIDQTMLKSFAYDIYEKYGLLKGTKSNEKCIADT